MELDERKRKILHAIVKNYLETGEPVGSRTISKDPEINLSSATIRNEMADLEEMGLIIQPHTSAGRIPSDQGYRVYVDEMLRDKEEKLENMKEMLLDKEEKLENLLKQVAKTLAIDTNYATMISAPQLRKNKLKFIQISKVDNEHLLATIVIEGNVIKNKIIPVEEVLDDATMLKLNILMNTRLDGLAVEDINLGLIAAVKQEAGIHSEIIGNVIDAAAESITADTGMDVLTHSLEAYVSNMASDYTDGLAEKAVELVFKYLEKAYDDGTNKEAREKMHNASTIAGMAFTNAFLGISHSLAHKIGAEFHLPHGRINAILLPYVIKYNSSKPTKFVSFPKYEYFIADEKYYELAKKVGLKAENKEEGINSLIEKVKELNEHMNIPKSFKEAGIEEQEFLAKVDMLADRAFEDQCTTANPRLPLVSELKQILLDSYYGK